jgi:hypothetical protein
MTAKCQDFGMQIESETTGKVAMEENVHHKVLQFYIDKKKGIGMEVKSEHGGKNNTYKGQVGWREVLEVKG